MRFENKILLKCCHEKVKCSIPCIYITYIHVIRQGTKINQSTEKDARLTSLRYSSGMNLIGDAGCVWVTCNAAVLVNGCLGVLYSRTPAEVYSSQISPENLLLVKQRFTHSQIFSENVLFAKHWSRICKTMENHVDFILAITGLWSGGETKINTKYRKQKNNSRSDRNSRLINEVFLF